VDSSGKPRELHIEKALEVTDSAAGGAAKSSRWRCIHPTQRSIFWPRAIFLQQSDGIATGPHPLKAIPKSFSCS